MNRRDFSKVVGLGSIAFPYFPAIASAKKRKPPENLKIALGLCNHSLRSSHLNAQQFIDFAIQHQLDSVLFNSFHPFESLDHKYLSTLHNKATSKNTSIYIGIGSISEKSTKFSNQYGSAQDLLIKGIEVAASLGSPIVGCRIGSIEDRYLDGGIEAHIEAVVKEMTSVRSMALDANIKFAIENHMGDLRSEELLMLIHETGSDICGALFDPANAVWAMEEPMDALEKLGASVICTSVRDVDVWESKEGATFQGKAIGQGMLNFEHIAGFMSKNCKGVPLHVETISNSNRSIPFLKPEFWQGFPNLLATDIIDFIRFIKRGKPQEIKQPSDGIDKQSFDIEQQKSELIASFNYLRKFCNGGLK